MPWIYESVMYIVLYFLDTSKEGNLRLVNLLPLNCWSDHEVLAKRNNKEK
jgi:hypothetical protein